MSEAGPMVPSCSSMFLLCAFPLNFWGSGNTVYLDNPLSLSSELCAMVVI